MPEKAQPDIWAELRKPFPKESISKLPKGGITLDFIGHAGVTDRLNHAAGPDNWNWEPMAFDEDGNPKYTVRGQMAIMWGRFTVNGITKPAVGTSPINKMELEKELIGDLIRNGAMRFGVALDLWSKDELESNVEHPENKNVKPTQAKPAPKPLPEVVEEEAVSDDMLTKLKGQVKLKGIADDKKAGGILEALAQKEYKRTSAAMTVDQARALYLLIRDSSTRDDLLDLLKQESAHAEI